MCKPLRRAKAWSCWQCLVCDSRANPEEGEPRHTKNKHLAYYIDGTCIQLFLKPIPPSDSLTNFCHNQHPFSEASGPQTPSQQKGPVPVFSSISCICLLSQNPYFTGTSISLLGNLTLASAHQGLQSPSCENCQPDQSCMTILPSLLVWPAYPSSARAFLPAGHRVL